MTSNPPKGQSRAAGGVLPVNAVARKNAAQQASGKSPRAPAPRLRLVVRRLPPGLTEDEFWTALGGDWKVGAGKVEWAAFKGGKVSKDPAKPSRPARVYIKVKDPSLLELLSAAVKETTFQDAKNTTKDACLLGPPSLEFAPYNKTPSGRVRHDGRQGTIDQDQEFIDFLQSLTEPIAKATTEADSESKPKVSTTPLIQFIKEKKANKAKEKEASQAKGAKSKDKDAKSVSNKSESARSTVVVKGKTAHANGPPPEKERVAKATQDAVHAINKSIAAMQGNNPPTTAKTDKTDSKQPAKGAAPSSSPQPAPAKKERERGNASAAARMLQRDLGLVAKENQSRRGGKASSTPATVTAETAAAAPTKPTTTDSTTTKPSTASTTSTTTTPTPPTGPRASRTPSAASAASGGKSAPTTTQRPAKTGPQPSAGAKSAFLKHANLSQGVTEEQLQTVFGTFGTVTRCEIDKKKGLGYVDFADPDGLKKAMAASPVKVADGQVVVLENKSQQGKRGGGGGGGGGQGGPNQGNKSSAKASSTSASASPAPAPTTTPATSSAATKPTKSTSAAAADSRADTPTTPTTATAQAGAGGRATPPTGPRGSSKGGQSGGRGGGGGARGGRANNARGSSGQQGSQGTQGTQGARQGGGRGGRGGQSGKRGGGGGGAASATGSNAPSAAGEGASAAAPAKQEVKKD